MTHRPFSYSHIPGWFDFEQVYDHAVEHLHDGAVWVELGVWLGKSTAYALERIEESGKAIQFMAYDTFRGSPTEPEQQAIVAEHGGSIFAAAHAHLERCRSGYGDFICQHDSARAAELYGARSVHFLFIDADHTREGVLRDIHAWLPKMAPGAIMAGHDIDSPAVRAAVEEVFHSRYRVQGRCWIAPIPA